MKNHTNGTGNTNILRRVMILVAAIFTAIAVAVACALYVNIESPVGGGNGVGGDALTSSTYSNLTGDKTASGALMNGDIINYSYRNSPYSIKLPRGQYKLEVWGAQGGYYDSGCLGGKGGYTYATYDVTSSSGQYLYIVTGGQGQSGTSSAKSGGYNGGGDVDRANGGGGGGGATHIALVGGTLDGLSSTANQANVLVVAGGGGGSTTQYHGGTFGQGGYGGGANNNGGASSGGYPYSSSYQAQGGTSNGGGRAGKGASASDSRPVTGQNGYFGHGGKSYSGGYEAGGGWWGGGGGGGDSYSPGVDGRTGGGGGSGHIKSGLSGSGSNGTNSGNGRATITVISVNQVPESRNSDKELFVRGTGSAVINASDIAYDPENTNVYFTNGEAANLDNFTTTANTGLYLYSNCTGDVTKYFDWKWNSSSQFTITNVKMYPRSGVDGSPANGKLKLYARVRDNFGTSATMRGWSVIPFTVTVPATKIELASTAPKEITATTPGTTNTYSYLLGNSTTTSLQADGNVKAGEIYNPSGTKRPTIMLTNSLRKDTSFTINASDLVKAVNLTEGLYSGANGLGDKAIIVLNSTTSITGNARKYCITEYDANNKVTAYNSGRVAIANAFEKISIKCIAPEPGFQMFSVTVHVVEKITAWGSSYPNVVPGCNTVSIDILFKMDNTRPVLKDTIDDTDPNNDVPALTIPALGTATLDLNTFFSDSDTPKMMASTHQILEVKVPAHEYVQLDKYGRIKSLANKNNVSYFNLAPTSGSLSNADLGDAATGALVTGQLEGSMYETGFSEGLISSGASDTAYVQYSINNSNLTITFTGLRATYNMYKTGRDSARVIKHDEDGNIAVDSSARAANAGHFYVLIKLLDRNDSADEGIWLPIGLTVTNADPTDMSRERGGAGASAMPTANGVPAVEGAPDTSFYFTPMGITVDRVTYPIGARKEGNALVSDDLNPLAADSDNFYTTNMLNGASLGSNVVGKLNELVTITSDSGSVQSSVTGNSEGTFFTVEPIDIYIPAKYFYDSSNAKDKTGRILLSKYAGANNENIENVNGENYVKVLGLKVTLKNWTHNRYLHATVNLEDSGNRPITAKIAVNVHNTAPRSYTADERGNVATLGYSANGMNVSSSYTPADGTSPATIEYYIPMNKSVIITPYDMLTDANMTAGAVAGGFTLNGLSGVFDSSSKQFAVGASSTSGNTQSLIDGLGTADNVKEGGTDYSSSGYITRLRSTLGALQGTRTFESDFSSGNLFTSPVVTSENPERERKTGIDRLFFARLNDGEMLDGFTFDPYAGESNFVRPAVGDSLVRCNFGTSLKFTDGSESTSYNIDYLVITALDRTQTNAPVEILLTVRDRMGSGASGVSNGVTTIRVRINVVNSSPRVQYPNKVYTLSTAPIGSATETITDVTAGMTVTPSTIIINAYGYTGLSDLNKNFLVDNERDPVMFYPGEAVSVDDGKLSYDENNIGYLDNYLSVSITSSQLTITALNSTQRVKTLYVYFTVTDGRYRDGKLETFRCKIQVEVINAAFDVNRDSDGFKLVSTGDTEDAPKLNLWNVETLDQTDFSKTRYFSSSRDMTQQIINKKNASSDQVRRLTNDSDGLQSVILSPVSNPEAIGIPNHYTLENFTRTNPDGSKVIDYNAAVPRIGITLQANTPIAAILALRTTRGTKLSAYFPDGAETTLYRDYIDILYYVYDVDEHGNHINEHVYSANTLSSAGDTTVKDNPDKFFDAKGRWKVKDWAISITPNKNTPSDEYLEVRIMMSDDAVCGGGTMGIDDAYKNNEAKAVNGYRYISYQLSISSLGIVPYTQYDAYGGYYTVRDVVNTSTSYVPTYDGNKGSLFDTNSALSTLYLDGNGNVSASVGGTSIKTRNAGEQDNTLAGIHSGVVYSSTENYVYDVRADVNGAIQTIRGAEKAFRYSDTINVSGDNTQTTYIPMSYFGLRSALVSANPVTGAVEYSSKDYVAYNISAPYSRSSISLISSAITISDGVNTWSGNLLDQNPYVTVTAYDAYSRNLDSSTQQEEGLIANNAAYRASLLGDYFNKALTVSTVVKSGDTYKPVGYFGKEGDTDGSVTAANAKNLVGADGKLMYLADQTTKLQEHMFGLGFKKKNTRASASSLTVTIDIADCQYDSTAQKTVLANASKGDASATNDDASASKDDTSSSATVSFKLEIGNSPIEFADNQVGTLDTAAIRRDNNGNVVGGGYYYTNVSLDTASKPFTLGLLRSGVDVPKGADKYIKYTDKDVVTNDDKTIDESKSDKAYFYTDSMYKLESWGGDGAYYKRVKEYGDGDDFVFENSSSKAAVQYSMANFFGTRNGSTFNSATSKADLDAIDSTFQPNDGIYGSNMSSDGMEGFSKFFTTNVSGDGTMLTITPLAKTTLNENEDGSAVTNSNRLSYYAERGLEYDAKQKKGYYPLKVLIYDSHGDGFAAASYIALEIRVYIGGAAPTLSSALKDYDDKKDGNKRIDISLPVTGAYNFDLYDVIQSESLLKNGREIFWQSDYKKLCEKQNRTKAEQFDVDTGTYLMSPFSDNAYNWRPASTDGSDLRNGTAKLTDGKLKKDHIDLLPDVTISMDYTGTFGRNAVPNGNTITVDVNRRSTYNGKQLKEFSFNMVFTDSDKNTTKKLYIIVSVTNQAPTVRPSVLKNMNKVKMRVNDSFTVVTTPYDKFNGVLDGNKTSAEASTSYSYIVRNPGSVGDPNLVKPTSAVKYSELTTEHVDNPKNVEAYRKYQLHDYDPTNMASQHLGYLAIADDDTPWGLRITSVKYYDPTCFNVTQVYDKIPVEGKTSGDTYSLDQVIVAHSVCKDMPVTITVMDAEGATVSFTIYVTVESSKPSPIPHNDKSHKRHEGLLTTYNDNGAEQLGVFDMYMTAYTEKTEHLTNVNVNRLGTTETVKNVYGKVTFAVNEIAYDPDYTDNGNIALYTESSDYNVFTFNDMPMMQDENNPLKYSNDLFEIEISDDDFKSFTLTCLTFNPLKDWDELRFYVRDVGNNIFDNATPITIRLCTLNSEITNEHQAKSGSINNGVINSNIIDTVYVKAYDDYSGMSAEVLELPEDERKAIIGAPSTYQFLNYKNAPASVDQPSTDGWGINDADVVNNVYNKKYTLRVYALMANSAENTRVFKSLTAEQASPLFDIAPQQMQRHYWSLKRDANGELPDEIRKYFVGGVSANGGMISGTNNALVMFLQQYFTFDIGDDGVSLSFRPVTANIKMDVLFYVEVEKSLDMRSITRTGASVTSGTLFYVKVKNSAPTTNTVNENLLNFEGGIGDSKVFKIFDNDNSYDSLFADTDLNDYVEIKAFESKTGVDKDYEAALAGTDCDWQSKPGVLRAIDILVNNDTTARDGVPARSLRIDIRRRIDVRDEDGNYLPEVTIPVVLTGTDHEGGKDGTTTVTLNITIKNTEMAFNDEKLAETPRKIDTFGAGYEIVYDEANDLYEFNTYVVPDAASLTLKLVVDGWLTDADFTSISADTDSYKLVAPIDPVNIKKYMIDGAIDVYPESEDGKAAAIAKIEPVYGNNGVHVDANHFTGFTITATSYTRGVTGVAYMRIIDRSSNPLTSAGITIRVNVTVLNTAPNVKVGMDNRHMTIVGSDRAASAPITIDIKDYVEDKNNDVIHIFGVTPLDTDDAHCSVEENTSGSILSVEPIVVEGAAVDKFTVVSRPGFYGTQTVLVTVADGDLSTDFNARTVMYTISFTVIYDFSQVDELKTVSAKRSLPVKITPEKLFKDIRDTYSGSDDAIDSVSSGRALLSADENKTFNPGSDYIIKELTPDDANVTVNLDSDGDWQFVCTREATLSFHVSFIRKVDEGNDNAQVFGKTFTAVVGKNSSPELIEQIRRNGEFTFHTRDGEYGLDSNGRVTLTTDMLFGDVDIKDGDVLTFDPAVTEVVSSTMCTVEVSEDGLLLYLTFNTRGETDITIGVKDRTGETVKSTFRIKNIDRPEPSFMDSIIISYESYPFIWLGAGAGLLLLILLIILIVILVKRRKRKQEELEAILLSEMELEEQMMRLAGGAASMPYQSFGYLPPTVPVQNDPGMMLGGGENAAQTDVIGLNPGADQPNGNSDNNM